MKQYIKVDKARENDKLRGHKLLPNDLRKKLPPLYSQEHVGKDALALVKFFDPVSAYTWYASEFDGQDIFYGLVSSGLDAEYGYFSLTELAELHNRLGLPLERDLYFEPMPLGEIEARHYQELS